APAVCDDPQGNRGHRDVQAPQVRQFAELRSRRQRRSDLFQRSGPRRLRAPRRGALPAHPKRGSAFVGWVDARDGGRKPIKSKRWVSPQARLNPSYDNYAVLPASTVITVPVMFFAPSPSRNATVEATSSTSGSRRSALRRATWARCSPSRL